MSKTRKKNLLCLVFAAICCLFAGILFGSTTKASAATAVNPKTFEMVSGASIRITDGQVNGKDMTNGLRFQVKTDAETAKLIDGKNVKLYAFIAPVGVIDLTSNEKVAAAADNIVGYKSKWLEIAADSIYPMTEESGEVCYYANAVICNLSSDFYDVKFNAIAIIENGGAYTYAKAVSTSRSLYDVVNSAVLDKYADRIVGESVAKNTKLDYANWYGKGEYPVSPNTAAQYAKYNELKGTMLKNLDIVRQDVLVDNATVTIGGTSYPIDIPSEHGEQEVSVTVDDTEITVPVTIIDAVLTAENLKVNIQSQGTALGEGKYFILTDNIDAGSIDWSVAPSWDDENTFRGTIDGRGYTISKIKISQDKDTPGIFNRAKKAVIKNVNFTIASFVPCANYSVFGTVISDSIFENVNITFNCTFNATVGSILAGQNAPRNTYNNVVIDADGSEINYLVCPPDWGYLSRYEKILVYADKVNYIYGTETEKDGITVKETVKVNLTENQDIVMTDETYSLNLGDEQTGLTVTSILCDGKILGTDLSNLDLSAFKSDYAKHGEKTVIVKGVKDDSRVRISVPVTFVTMMVSTVNDLRTITRTATDTEANAIFGYYKMANDINCNGDPDWQGFYNNAGFDFGKDTTGFRGTLNGNGYTITGKCNQHGLFRVIGKGAVIKNITFVSVQWTGAASGGLFGYAAFGTTFDNVNVLLKSTDGSTPKDGALLFSSSCSGNTFNKLTVKVYSDDGVTLAENIPTVFGAWVYNNNYTDVKVYCKSYVKLATDGKNADVTEIENVTVYNTETEE